jgi:hypothetical protein
MSAPSLKVVVAITSPIAFESLSNETVLHACLQTSLAFVEKYGSTAQLSIAGSEQDLAQVSDSNFERIVCNPNDPHQLAVAIQSVAPTDYVMIHDSQRALTSLAQFDRVYAALTEQVDAVRPVSAFTETLKSVTDDHFVAGTIDRNSMSRISTPELIRFSAIDFQASTSTWFVPLLDNTKIATVAADLESARINSEKELKLMQNLLELK